MALEEEWRDSTASEQAERTTDIWLLKIETQNNNVPACRFYAKQGCELGAIVRYAHKEYPEGVELVWYKGL